MNDETLWTVSGTLIAAFFTSVISQYFFAPALEARKQRMLARSEANAQFVDQFNRLRNTIYHMSRVQYGPPSGNSRNEWNADRARLLEVLGEIDPDVSRHFESLTVPRKTFEFALSALDAIYDLFDRDQGDSGRLKRVAKIVEHAQRSIDPVHVRPVRFVHRILGGRMCRKNLPLVSGRKSPGSR